MSTAAAAAVSDAAKAKALKSFKKGKDAVPITKGPKDPYSQLARQTVTMDVNSTDVKFRRARGDSKYLVRGGRPLHPSMFDMIMPQLLVHHSGDKMKEKQRGDELPRRPAVFSAVNAYEGAGQTKYEYFKNTCFAGTAQGGISFRPDYRPNDTVIAVTTAGTHSIYNNGTSPIYAGDYIWADAVTINADGEVDENSFTKIENEHPQKVPAVVTSRYTPAATANALFEMYREYSATPVTERDALKGSPGEMLRTAFGRDSPSGTSAADVAVREDALKLFTAILEASKLISRRIFAKATSNANPGNLVDVLLMP